MKARGPSLYSSGYGLAYFLDFLVKDAKSLVDLVDKISGGTVAGEPQRIMCEHCCYCN